MNNAMQFQIMTPDEVRGQSVVEITKAVLSMSNRENTCIDPKMGCIGPKDLCNTCRKPMNTCNGHFGHIELGTYIFHPFFINELFRTVKFSCPLCRAYYPTKQRDCTRCNSIMGSWSRKLRKRDKFGIKDKFEYLYTERQTGHTKIIKPVTSVLYEILRHVGKENLLLSVLPVAPLCVRPTIISGSSRAKNTFDPLTLSYVLVVRESSMLKTFLRYHQAPHIIKHQWRRTQDAVYQIYDTSKLTDNGQGVQGLRQRIDGKQGRFRQNLLGKRCDYCARTVITADPSLDLDEIGVPKSIAMRLTKSVTVTPFNISVLREMIRTGPNELGGALYVTSANGKIEYDLAFVQSVENICGRLGFGDVVDRMLVDGDWVALNRQPSLHKFSLMGHRVKILDYSTFRLNLSSVTPYNADFDGDAGEIHHHRCLLFTI
jgi:DNA-directed RNA polymerase II subunit RPB1